VPGYQAELTARRSALQEFLARDAAERSSAYFSDLAKIDAAGSLEEYVWHFLRDAKLDETQPANLDLAAFQDWLARNFPAHIVRTGAHVRVSTVRALPLDPAP
jgi:hypothetical protein